MVSVISLGADVASTLEISPDNCGRYKEDEHAESLRAKRCGREQRAPFRRLNSLHRLHFLPGV